MLERILPQTLDNRYEGHRLALWLLGGLVVMKGGIGIATMFNGYEAATSADGIPLETFSPAGAAAFVSLFAAWGLAQVVINAVGVLVLIRYRAAVPLVYLLLLFEHLARKTVFLVVPLEREGTPSGFYINLVLVALLLLGFVLSLWPRSVIKS